MLIEVLAFSFAGPGCARACFKSTFLFELTVKSKRGRSEGRREEGRVAKGELRKSKEVAANEGLGETRAVSGNSARLTAEYRVKCLWLAGPGSRERGPAVAQVLWLHDYKAGAGRRAPATGAAAARETAGTPSSSSYAHHHPHRVGGRGVYQRVGGWVGWVGRVDVVRLSPAGLNLARDRRRSAPPPLSLPHPPVPSERKPQVQGSRLQTGSCCGFQKLGFRVGGSEGRGAAMSSGASHHASRDRR